MNAASDDFQTGKMPVGPGGDLRLSTFTLLQQQGDEDG